MHVRLAPLRDVEIFANALAKCVCACRAPCSTPPPGPGHPPPPIRRSPGLPAQTVGASWQERLARTRPRAPPRATHRPAAPLRRRRPRHAEHAHRPRSRTSSPDASPDRKRGSPSALRPEAQGTTGRRDLRHDGLRPDRCSSAHCPRRIPPRARRGANHRFLSNPRPAPTASEDRRAIDARRNPWRTHSASPSSSFACASSASSVVARRMSNVNAIWSAHWGRMPASR